MTRGEARRLWGNDAPGTDDNGPDPTEDPILYIEEDRREGKEEDR